MVETHQLPPPPPPAPTWNGATAATAARASRTPLGFGIAALVGCAYVAAVDPNQTSAFPFCPFRAATGLDCPGCGITRSVRALLGGDIVRAADHNVLWVIVVPVLVYGWVVWLARSRGRRLPWPSGLGEKTWLVGVAAAVMLAFWIARAVAGPDAWIASGA